MSQSEGYNSARGKDEAGSDLTRFGMDPRLAVGPPQQAVGFVVSRDPPRGGIPRQRPPHLQRQIAQDAARRGDVPLLDIRYRFAARRDCTEEILHVRPDRRSALLLQLRLRVVLRVLVQLVSHVLLDRLSLPPRGKVVAKDARLERALVAVERRAPRVFGIGRRPPPVAVLPQIG